MNNFLKIENHPQLFFILIVLLLSACSIKRDMQQTSVKLFYNGQVITVNSKDEIVDAIAISGEKILMVGTYQAIKNDLKREYVLEEIDLQGNTLMPGIYDAHSHPIWGGLQAVKQFEFLWDIKPEILKVRLKEYIAQNQFPFVYGGSWASDYFEKYKIDNPIEWLSNINNDLPIILVDDSGHNIWTNYKSLELAGIDKDTPSPENGTIVRNADGTPNGILLENATYLVRELANYDKKAYQDAFLYSQEKSLSYGIVGVKDAGIQEEITNAVYELDEDGSLKMFIAICQQTPMMVRDTVLDIQEYISVAKKYSSDNISANFIKFYLDGVPTSARTAAMLCAYEIDEKHEDHTHGFIHIQEEILSQDIANLDEAGFLIKIHAAGDSSARATINAIEFARNRNGMNDKYHEIAHAGYINESDIPRLKSLNIAADLSPYLWFPSPIMDNIVGAVCAGRGDQYWPIRTLYDKGVFCIAGSDWPSVARSINPWVGIEATVTRQDPYSDDEATFWIEEALDLKKTLRIFTLNGAKALNRDKVSGSLEEGKLADFIILNRPLLDIPPKQISDVKILNTYYKGALVYEVVSL